MYQSVENPFTCLGRFRFDMARVIMKWRLSNAEYCLWPRQYRRGPKSKTKCLNLQEALPDLTGYFVVSFWGTRRVWEAWGLRWLALLQIKPCWVLSTTETAQMMVQKQNDVSQPSRATVRSYRKLYYISFRHYSCLGSMRSEVTDTIADLAMLSTVWPRQYRTGPKSKTMSLNLQ